MNSQPINALLQRLLTLLTNFEFQDRFDESFNGINGVLYDMYIFLFLGYS